LIPLCTPFLAETVQTGSRTAAPAITEPIDDTRVVPLHGNVRADLSADRDLGPVEDTLPLRLYLVLQRSPAQQAALENLIERQQQPTAPEFHQWITPQQFGERFGASEQDIAKVTAWLESHGMRVHGVMNNASFIDFAATARDVRETFGTQLHYFKVGDNKHPALVQDPMIPAAMATVVAGIQGLNKIPAHANHTKSKQVTYDSATHKWQTVEPANSKEPKPLYSDGGGNYNVTPQDFYTIYNVNPVFTSASGSNANVAVIEESDIEYGTVNATTHAATGGDVATFRTLFGVNAHGALNMHVYHGYGTVKCNDPGIDPKKDGEEGEAALDAEWASALAPAANLIFMSCDQSPNQGIVTSEMALIDNNISDTMSLSYGSSELGFASSDYASQDTLYAQAATQGQSFLVSAGDSGSDVNDQNTAGSATSGINVSGFSSSPLVTVAGGTDFSDYYDALSGGVAQSTYWGATNSATFGEALGYVPETAWNESCASSIVAAHYGYTGAGYCATGYSVNNAVIGGSGGFSTHYAVPSYQSGITGYSGTKRAQPDISAFASSGLWSHELIYCDSYVSGSACSASGTTLTTFGGAGGTSFVAPQMAGIFGLLVSYTGTRQGLLNPELYALAKSQFTAAATKSACYSNGTTSNTGVTTGRPASTCVFNDVTSSNNDVPCASGATGCYVDSNQPYGVLSRTGAASLTVAFPSTPGYDEVTGIGTLNVANLFTNWNKAFTSTTTVGASATSITSAQSTTLTGTVKGGTPTGFSGKAPTLAGAVSFKAGTKLLGSCTLSSGTCTLAVPGTSFAIGSNSITATFAGSKTYPASTSSALTVTVTAAGVPVAGLSTTSLAFGPEGLGVQTAAQTVTLKNTGNVALNISSIALGGTNPTSFAITAKTCGTTLAAAASCTFSAAFKPTVTGTLSASITVTDNAAGSPQHVALTGTGVTTALTLTPATLTFGSENVGSTSTGQLVSVKNTSAAAITFGSISFSGADPTSFGALNNCHTTLGAGASCNALISFIPKTTGALSGSLNIASSVATEKVALSGTGIATAALSFSPSPLAFPTTKHGTQSAASIITVTNTGTTTATFGFIGIGGTNYADFYQLNTCGTSLATGAKCYFFVVFKPAAATAYTATLELFDNAQGGYQGINLTGTGN
jgi:hypothetical protein